MKTRKTITSVLTVAVAGLVLALGSVPAGAGIIAEDGFAIGGSDYTDGAALPGQNPTRTGFTAAWASSSGSSSRAGGLAVPANGTVGAVGATGGSNGHFQTDNNSGSTYRNMSAGSTASEMWVRWLWDPAGNNAGYLGLYTTSSSLWMVIGNTADELFSVSGFTSGATVSLSGGAHLIVIHIAIDRASGVNDVVRAWVDPDSYSDLTSLSNPDQTHTGLNLFEGAGELTQWKFDLNGVGTRLDEFAVGTELSDIFEPPAAATPGTLIYGK